MNADHDMVSMDYDGLMNTIEHAARSAMKKEIDILRNGKVERNFTACLANEIAGHILVDKIRVDAFYNKHLGSSKELGGKIIELDVAIHERNVDPNNLVAIELETSNHPTRDDLWKLEKLTQESYGYGYKLGLYIVFGIKENAGRILILDWYKDGNLL